MWFFTRYGFYSVACGQQPSGATDPSSMMIRARSIGHVQNLKARFPVLAKSEILTLAERDYRWRLIVPKEVSSGIVAELAQEQEWSNFKNEVARHQGAGSDYSHTWSFLKVFREANTTPGRCVLASAITYGIRSKLHLEWRGQQAPQFALDFLPPYSRT